MEGGNSFNRGPIEVPRAVGPIESPEGIRARIEDAQIKASFGNPDSERALYEANPVSWLRGAIGLRTERGASEVPDEELMERYIHGGKFEWDPRVAKQVAKYLKGQGFQWTR